MGADQDTGKAWELMRRQQATADAIGLGEISDHYQVGLRTVVNKETQRLTNVVTRVPVTTGATLRRLLQVRAVRYVQKELGHYFNNNLVLFLSGMRNYDMAVAMSDYTKNLSFADATVPDGCPHHADLAGATGVVRQGQQVHAVRQARQMLEASLSGYKNKLVSDVVGKSHVIVGTFAEIKAVGNATNLDGKTLITSAVDDERMAFFTKCKVNLVIDVSPKLFPKVVGINTIEAMILAALEKSQEEVSDDDFDEILDELHITAPLAAPHRQVPQHPPLCIRDPPAEPELHQERLAHSQGHTQVCHGQGRDPGCAHATHGVLQDEQHRLAHRCRGRRLVDQRRRHAQGDAVAKPRVHLPPPAAGLQDGRKMGAQIMGLGAFTKVVGDAGVTVARRSSLPITTGNSYSASGALWAAADAMRRMGLLQINKTTKRWPPRPW
jgi:hypothetical protein